MARQTKAARAEKLISDITFTITVERDDQPIRGAFASGDDARDRADETELITRLENGDTWAWAYVTVTGHCKDRLGFFEAADALGGCSYADEADFRAGPYFTDMCETIRADIADQIRCAIPLSNGEVFTRGDTWELAELLHKRFGRDIHATAAAWRRMLQNSATVDDLTLLIQKKVRP